MSTVDSCCLFLVFFYLWLIPRRKHVGFYLGHMVQKGNGIWKRLFFSNVLSLDTLHVYASLGIF